MSLTIARPDTDLVWRTKVVDFGGATDRPLDGLPVSVAAWWPGWQLRSSHTDPLVQADNAGDVSAGTTGQVLAAAIAGAGAVQSQYALELYDQSGNARPLTAADVPSAPKLFDHGALAFVQQNLSLALGYAIGKTMTRGDALGLSPDPALTVAFKLQHEPITPPVFAPNVLALGSSVTPALCLFVNSTIPPADVLGLTSFDGSQGASWPRAAGTVAGLHSYVVTKPEGSGYDVSGWKLYLDGVDQGPAVSAGGGALTLGSALTQLGDVPGGGFPLLGTLAGCIVWDRVLEVGELAQLQAFLDSV